MTVANLLRYDPLSSAIDEYFLAVECEGLSPRTLQAYGLALRRLHRCLGPVDPADISPTHLRAWLKALSEEGLSVTTRRDYLRPVTT